MKLRPTILVLLTAASLTLTARDFAHPGLSYTEGDIARMREMISTEQEPHAKTFEALKSSPYSAVTGKEFAAISSIPEGRFNNTVGVDRRCIHDLALLYRLTDDSRYADEAVRRLNRYNKLTNCSARRHIFLVSEQTQPHQQRRRHEGDRTTENELHFQRQEI